MKHEKGLEDETLRNLIDEIDNDREGEPKADIKKSEQELSVLDLPPRKEVHVNNKTRMKWKISFSLVRLLFVLFLFIVLVVLTYQIWGKRLMDSSEGVEQVTFAPNPAYEQVHIKAKNEQPFDKKEEPQSKLSNTEETKTETADVVNKQSEQTSPSNVIATPTQQERTSETKQDEKTVEQASTIYYEVKKGDTLFSIGMKYYGGKKGEQIIMDANNLSAKTVKVGQTLAIPVN
ncbi:LysM peptidoglycan-binding domain-containing protein [Aquibacillus salsiterrae]|uniref:LysM peptidoglycan-binding domain-containing protein n=1 Tax=Aquibacillus salsiterrae TaxID=2950439 RepID=A0A9X3WAT3_9BACI|nr:LysM peptidoglycan-binding domain-containing protein [Aquibacillus salsiterrae]MDC3415407.1 LysM peptidoglycan-binding domain-containing protein [Aquibacillus salsiterrae]